MGRNVLCEVSNTTLNITSDIAGEISKKKVKKSLCGSSEGVLVGVQRGKNGYTNDGFEFGEVLTSS